MRGSSPYEAIRAYTDLLSSALACVIAQPQVRPNPLEDKPLHGLLLNSGRSAPLTGTIPAIALQVRLFFRVVEVPESARRERYRVSITSYYYALVRADTRADPGAGRGSELLAFHWHPESADGALHVITFPHLHIGSSVLSEQALAKMHIPTQRVTIEDVVRLAIRDFNARPLDRDWEKRLQETSAEFERAPA